VRARGGTHLQLQVRNTEHQHFSVALAMLRLSITITTWKWSRERIMGISTGKSLVYLVLIVTHPDLSRSCSVFVLVFGSCALCLTLDTWQTDNDVACAFSTCRYNQAYITDRNSFTAMTDNMIMEGCYCPGNTVLLNPTSNICVKDCGKLPQYIRHLPLAEFSWTDGVIQKDDSNFVG